MFQEQLGGPDPIGPHRREQALEPALLDQGGERLLEEAPFDRVSARISRHPFVVQPPILGQIFVSQREGLDREARRGNCHGNCSRCWDKTWENRAVPLPPGEGGRRPGEGHCAASDASHFKAASGQDGIPTRSVGTRCLRIKTFMAACLAPRPPPRRQPRPDRPAHEARSGFPDPHPTRGPVAGSGASIARTPFHGGHRSAQDREDCPPRDRLPVRAGMTARRAAPPPKPARQWEH